MCIRDSTHTHTHNTVHLATARGYYTRMHIRWRKVKRISQRERETKFCRFTELSKLERALAPSTYEDNKTVTNWTDASETLD